MRSTVSPSVRTLLTPEQLDRLTPEQLDGQACLLCGTIGTRRPAGWINDCQVFVCTPDCQAPRDEADKPTTP